MQSETRITPASLTSLKTMTVVQKVLGRVMHKLTSGPVTAPATPPAVAKISRHRQSAV